jgi:predicted ATPase
LSYLSSIDFACAQCGITPYPISTGFNTLSMLSFDRRARDRAGLSPLGGLGNERGWVGASYGGHGKEGLAQVCQGIAALRATGGGALFVPYFCALLADACDHLGHTADGLRALAEAYTLLERHEERWWEAEIHRLRGVLLLRRQETPQAEAETWLRRALEVARRQEAKSLDLRAAMSLSRLRQQQGKRAEPYELLAPIYNWFTQSVGTADLQEAKALLEELS